MHQAGQYFRFEVAPKHWVDFSIANRPSPDHVIILHLRLTEAIAIWTNTLKIGDEIAVEGPFGHCILPSDDQPLLFIAGGTGFAPIYALLSERWTQKMESPVYLYLGIQHPRDAYIDLDPWISAHAEFFVVPVLSNVEAHPNWTGRTGLVHAAVSADFESLQDFIVFASGPYPMVMEGWKIASQRGVPIARFFSDMLPPD